MAGDDTHVAGDPAPLPRKPVAADVLATPGRGLEPRDQPAKRVIVIGGGLAGLVAAFELQRQGHEPLVLEARTASAGASTPSGASHRGSTPRPAGCGSRTRTTSRSSTAGSSASSSGRS